MLLFYAACLTKLVIILYIKIGKNGVIIQVVCQIFSILLLSLLTHNWKRFVFKPDVYFYHMAVMY